MPFLSQGGCIKDILVTEEEIIDRFVGHELWAWGSGTNGQMGNNLTINRSSPVQTISGGTNWRSSAQTANYHLSAIKTDGTLWLWGRGQHGTHGNNSTIFRSSPVQTISGGTNWKSVSTALGSTAAIKTDGTLWLWGYGFAGRLGTNSTINRSSPVQTISGGTNWKSVSISGGAPYLVGTAHTAAIKTDGTLWTWGWGVPAGANSSINLSSPVQTISGGTNWKSATVGFGVTAAIKTDGTLWTWGWNPSTAILGDGTVTNRSSPVQTISGGTNWKSVSTVGPAMGAIKTDGTLWLWGCNLEGRLGTNSTISHSSPVQTVSGGTNWRKVSVGGIFSLNNAYTTAAIKTDGTLWLWGSGYAGRLGNNTTGTCRSSPVQTISGGTNWRSVSVGTYTVSALCVTEF